MEESPYPPLNWSKKAAFPDGGRSSSTVVSVGEKAYVLFGRNSSGTYKNDCWQYDSQQNSWTKKSSCPGFPRVKPVSFELNGKIYTGLGYYPLAVSSSMYLYNDSLYLKDFWMYDPSTDIWERKVDIPLKGTDACSGFIYDGEIYVGMGFHGLSFGHEWCKYTPETNEWTVLNNFPGVARFGGVACSNGENVFFGTGYCTENISDWWIYYPEADTWKEQKNMPDKGRINPVALSVKKRIFVSTGRFFRGTLTGGHLKNDIIEYDIEKNIWYNQGRIPAPERENAIAFTIGNKGYIGLGENDKKLLDDLLCFEP
nr:kelch repeat-containing protein [Paludibacter sp. 221]